jgi:tRNA (guanine-N7-)-methyltransferase
LVAARAGARQAALAQASADFCAPPEPLVIELGCGHGHFLTAYATAHPRIRCLGVDRISLRIERALRKQGRHQLANLAFFKGDAAEMLAALPAHVRFAGIFVLFPDPWPKHRHHKHRFLQPALLDALAARAVSGAWLALRSDHAEFFSWAAAIISRHPLWQIEPAAPWPFEHPTVFQERLGVFQSLVAKKLP